VSVARLFHITTRAELDAALPTGHYRPQAFAREGFIHCSRGSQVAATAERIFRGRQDLVLLEIDPASLTCPVLDENLEGGQELYPHIYGLLPLSAIVAVHDMPVSADGGFTLPAAVKSA
jgi:uncharacterized protein (DUF952 family)